MVIKEIRFKDIMTKTNLPVSNYSFPINLSCLFAKTKTHFSLKY